MYLFPKQGYKKCSSYMQLSGFMYNVTQTDIVVIGLMWSILTGLFNNNNKIFLFLEIPMERWPRKNLYSPV